MKKIVLIEDNRDYAETISDFISLENEYQVKAIYKNGETALKKIRRNNPDIIFMDFELPKMNGIDCTRKIKEILPNVHILMLTAHENSDIVFNALCAGATGYLTKNTTRELLMQALNELNNGGAPMSMNIARMVVNSFKDNKNDSPLSKRETDTLLLLANGISYKEIGETLFISTETVKYYIKRIYLKLHVHNKIEAVMKAKEKKII